jgi:hypothetical protein
MQASLLLNGFLRCSSRFIVGEEHLMAPSMSVAFFATMEPVVPLFEPIIAQQRNLGVRIFAQLWDLELH